MDMVNVTIAMIEEQVALIGIETIQATNVTSKIEKNKSMITHGRYNYKPMDEMVYSRHYHPYAS